MITNRRLFHRTPRRVLLAELAETRAELEETWLALDASRQANVAFATVLGRTDNPGEHMKQLAAVQRELADRP